MSRYIDADALAYIVASNGDADFINKVTRLMIDAPSIDIVRCKECEWSEPTNDGWNSVTCNFYGETTLTMPTDGFCSYGERIEQ